MMGRVLAFDRTGAGAPLVLIHGLGSRRQIWDPVVPVLAERHDVLAVDLPGFGDSPVGAGTTIAKLLAALERFLDGHGLHRPHVAGNSLGGAIALELARRDRAASVTAFSPIGFWHAPGRAWCQWALGGSRWLAARTRPALPRLLTSTAGRAMLTGIAFGRPSRLDPATALADIDAIIAAPGFAEASASFTGYRFTDPAEVPTTIAWGSRDLLLTYRTQARRAREVIPRARHVTMPHSGHTPFYDDPPLAAGLILETTTN
jgi:pimeloyl-ACP methyl ester carboxylesterase